MEKLVGSDDPTPLFWQGQIIRRVLTFSRKLVMATRWSLAYIRGTSGLLNCLLNPWTPEATLMLREDIQTLDINKFIKKFNPWKSASVLEL